MKSSARKLTLLLVCYSTIILTSCSNNYTQRRIDKNPEMYSNLSKDDQQRVNSKQIARGMSKDAVYLTFGAPSNSTKGSKGGTTYERWYYSRLIPNYIGGYYPGYGSYGPAGYYGYGAGFSAFPEYSRELEAIVEFRKGAVYGWEDARR